MTFGEDGTLSSLTGAAATAGAVSVEDTTDNQLDLTFDFDQIDTTTADRVTVAVDFGSLNQADGFTQFQGNFTPNFIEQNGKQFGSLSAVNIDEAGITTALFDNGETRDIFQVPVITFNNPNGLQERTGNIYTETTASGPAVHWNRPRWCWADRAFGLGAIHGRLGGRVHANDRHATGLLGQYADHHHCG